MAKQHIMLKVLLRFYDFWTAVPVDAKSYSTCWQSAARVTFASSCCNDQASCTLWDAQLLKVSAVCSCKLCLIRKFAFVDSICVVHISTVNATEKGSQLLWSHLDLKEGLRTNGVRISSGPITYGQMQQILYVMYWGWRKWTLYFQIFSVNKQFWNEKHLLLEVVTGWRVGQAFTMCQGRATWHPWCYKARQRVRAHSNAAKQHYLIYQLTEQLQTRLTLQVNRKRWAWLDSASGKSVRNVFYASRGWPTKKNGLSVAGNSTSLSLRTG